MHINTALGDLYRPWAAAAASALSLSPALSAGDTPANVGLGGDAVVTRTTPGATRHLHRSARASRPQVLSFQYCSRCVSAVQVSSGTRGQLRRDAGSSVSVLPAAGPACTPRGAGSSAGASCCAAAGPAGCLSARQRVWVPAPREKRVAGEGGS